jgi:hypothetical protein
MNVVRKGFQRRDIDDLRLVLESVLDALAHEAIDGAQEGGQGLARAGRRGNENVTAGLDRRPGFGLGWGGRGKALFEPRAERGVKEIERHAKTVDLAAGCQPGHLASLGKIGAFGECSTDPPAKPWRPVFQLAVLIH